VRAPGEPRRVLPRAPHALVAALAAAIASAGSVGGCLSPVPVVNPAPMEGPLRAKGAPVEMRIERYHEYGKGRPRLRALLRARRLSGKDYGATLWVVRIDTGSDDADVDVPDEGALTLSIEARPDGEVAIVTGSGRPQRFRVADGAPVEE